MQTALAVVQTNRVGVLIEAQSMLHCTVLSASDCIHDASEVIQKEDSCKVRDRRINSLVDGLQTKDHGS